MNFMCARKKGRIKQKIQQLGQGAPLSVRITKEYEQQKTKQNPTPTRTTLEFKALQQSINRKTRKSSLG